ncbi:biopolymer transporter ExbD [Desulfomicrobium orale]|uniref:biopolymer transporter ExbD n=1 Tax=Desulfomicrobium orale TaxID=132132 RepID=UPI000AFF0EE2|nr:biopolymer transporter ExbD [Desulfomicrobium orale]
MISIRRTLRSGRTAEINMAPLIDLVFLLLIFFLVTTSFVKESGVDVGARRHPRPLSRKRAIS